MSVHTSTEAIVGFIEELVTFLGAPEKVDTFKRTDGTILIMPHLERATLSIEIDPTRLATISVMDNQDQTFRFLKMRLVSARLEDYK